MTWLHSLKGCAETAKILHTWIQELSTNHQPLFTFHLATPPFRTRGPLIQSEKVVVQTSLPGRPPLARAAFNPQKPVIDRTHKIS